MLPHQSTMVLFDPDTGQPISLIGANRITGLRTGAAGAVAAKHLASADSTSAAIIGCGAHGPKTPARAGDRVRTEARFGLGSRRGSLSSFASDLATKPGCRSRSLATRNPRFEAPISLSPRRPAMDQSFIRVGSNPECILTRSARTRPGSRNLILDSDPGHARRRQPPTGAHPRRIATSSRRRFRPRGRHPCRTWRDHRRDSPRQKIQRRNHAVRCDRRDLPGSGRRGRDSPTLRRAGPRGSGRSLGAVGRDT